jgi:hypothetical protein
MNSGFDLVIVDQMDEGVTVGTTLADGPPCRSVGHC